MNILTHLFRFVLLITIGVVFLFFTEIEHKLEIMIGWMIGVTLAYIVGTFILQRRRKKNE